MDRREFMLKGIGAVAGIGAAGALQACGGGGGGDVTDPGDDGGDGGGNGGGGGGTADHTIEVRDDFFSPSSLTIEQGESVEWVHMGGNFHTITPRPDNSEWQRQEFPDGSSPFMHTFDNAGTFDYFCEPHESVGMEGTITVQASSS